jgi:hypothetical protein
MRCLRKTEKIIWVDHVKNKILHRVNMGRNVLHKIKENANRIGHILRKNSLLRHFNEVKIEVRVKVVRRGVRCCK